MARRRGAGPIGLALAGGGPFGALYEAGALMALQEGIAGLELHDLDCYVGVSAGSFLAAALANGIPIEEIHDLVVAERDGEGGLTPELFMRPAWREYVRRAQLLPGLLGRLAWRTATRPWAAEAGAALSSLGRALPTGVFDNEAIHRFLAATFAAAGRTNDFRQLDRRLYIVATHLDSGETVSFGRAGHDEVPISRAVQASAALPGLFPPVQIVGRSYVDGALKKTLHASEALDDGMRLVLCVNPIVPFDARLAALRGRGPQDDLVEGGLPLVLSQTFRAVIHARMAVGFSKYAAEYPDADVLLFEPEPDDGEGFLTHVFGYAGRRRICEHAYQRTRRDLARRAATLRPVLRRHGLDLRMDVLSDEARTLPVARGPVRGDGLRAAAARLDGTLARLRRWTERQPPA